MRGNEWRAQAGRHKNWTKNSYMWLCLQYEFCSNSREKKRTTSLTEYLEYIQNWKACKSMKRKAGDGDRTRDVQLGKLAFYR